MDLVGRERAQAALERTERGFVRALGGYTVGLAGGTLLVNERIPLPRFNVVQAVRVARGRRTQFFEGALDHYYQRALRPRFRVEDPVPAHVAETLEHLGYRPQRRSELWLVAGPDRPAGGAVPGLERTAPEALDEIVAWWADGREGVELRRQVEVGMLHPNPGESLAPLAYRGTDGALRSVGLAYRRGEAAVLEAVLTVPGQRGGGAATAWVRGALGEEPCRGARYVGLRTEEPRLGERLAPMGFEPAGRFRSYELDPAAELRVPVAPSNGPLWRPPRA